MLIIVNLCLQVFAAQTVKLIGQDNYVSLADSLEFNISNPSQPADTPPIEGWSIYPYSQIQLDNSVSTYWFRTHLKNNSIHPKTYYLELANPLIDNLTVYILADGKVRSVQQLGDHQEFFQRPVLHESFVVPIRFNANEELELYISLYSPSYLKVPVGLWQVEAFQQEQGYQRLLSGIYIGIVLAMILATIFTFSFGRDLLLLFDGLFLLSLLMLTLTASGVGFHYLWPNSPAFQQHAFYLFTCLAILFSALAASKNLQHFYFDQRLIRLFQGLSVFSVLMIPVTLLVSYQLGLFLIITLAMIICIGHIFVGVVSWRQGLHEHQELNFGLFGLLATLLLIGLNTFDLVHLPISNLALLQIAVLAQILFMLVTGVRNYGVSFNTFGEQESEDDDKDLQLSEQMLELQFALKELQEKNEQLEKLNTLDELSGIHNRRHFDKRLQAELRRGRRELSPLSLIIFDIDHFKKFNDTYGHIAGDEVIRTVALTASQQLNRDADEIFRYGGEEYAIILPNTELEGAVYIAEKVRTAIQDLTIIHNEQAMHCTISLGVACHLSEQAIQPKDFIEQSDKALYQAKQNGRNQVVQYNEPR